MPRPKALIIALALAVTLALGLAACGGSNLLSGTTASEIDVNLDTVRELVEKEDCAGAEEAVDQVQAQVDELEGVNGELKEALSEAAEHLGGVVVSNCEEEEVGETALNSAELEEAEEEDEREREREERPPKPKPEEEETTPNEPGGQEQGEEGEEGEEGLEESEETPSGGVSPSAPAGEG